MRAARTYLREIYVFVGYEPIAVFSKWKDNWLDICFISRLGARAKTSTITFFDSFKQLVEKLYIVIDGRISR